MNIENIRVSINLLIYIGNNGSAMLHFELNEPYQYKVYFADYERLIHFLVLIPHRKDTHNSDI